MQLLAQLNRNIPHLSKLGFMLKSNVNVMDYVAFLKSVALLRCLPWVGRRALILQTTLTVCRKEFLEILLKLQSRALFTKDTLQLKKKKKPDIILKPQGICKDVVQFCEWIWLQHTCLCELASDHCPKPKPCIVSFSLYIHCSYLKWFLCVYIYVLVHSLPKGLYITRRRLWN